MGKKRHRPVCVGVVLRSLSVGCHLLPTLTASMKPNQIEVPSPQTVPPQTVQVVVPHEIERTAIVPFHQARTEVGQGLLCVHNPTHVAVDVNQGLPVFSLRMGGHGHKASIGQAGQQPSIRPTHLIFEGFYPLQIMRRPNVVVRVQPLVLAQHDLRCAEETKQVKEMLVG